MTPDLQLATSRLLAIAAGTRHPDPTEVVAFVFEGKPIAKERPRWSGATKSFYTPKTTQAAEKDLAWTFRAAQGRRSTFTDTVAIVALFYVPTRHRKDVDNCMKLVMDAGNQSGIWKDDSQVIAQASFIELDPRHPRTVVALCPCVGTMTRDRQAGR